MDFVKIFYRDCGEGEIDISSIVTDRPEEAPGNLLQCPGQDDNSMNWNDVCQDLEQPIIQTASPGAASSDSCDTAAVAGVKKRKNTSGASSTVQKQSTTDQEQKKKVNLESNTRIYH